MAGTRKVRLDRLIVRRGLADDEHLAAALLVAGRILVNGRTGIKAGTMVPADVELTLKKSEPYVSRGGRKLEGGLQEFAIDPRGWICADIGCSTGGFTDCLLNHGARRVYAVDVGYGVLDWKLRTDERVVVLERCNARFIGREQIPEPIDLCVVDASFISLTLLLRPLLRLFGGPVRILALIKPQFELARQEVEAGGVVRDATLRQRAVTDIEKFAAGLGLASQGVIPAPVRGARGNQEYLMLLTGTVAQGSQGEGESHEKE